MEAYELPQFFQVDILWSISAKCEAQHWLQDMTILNIISSICNKQLMLLLTLYRHFLCIKINLIIMLFMSACEWPFHVANSVISQFFQFLKAVLKFNTDALKNLTSNEKASSDAVLNSDHKSDVPTIVNGESREDVKGNGESRENVKGNGDSSEG